MTIKMEQLYCPVCSTYLEGGDGSMQDCGSCGWKQPDQSFRECDWCGDSVHIDEAIECEKHGTFFCVDGCVCPDCKENE